MTPTPEALKVHWKLPLKAEGDDVYSASNSRIASFAHSDFEPEQDADHAAAFVTLANGAGNPWKDVAEELRSLKASFDTLWNASAEMIEEVSRLRAQLDKPVAVVEPEWPKWFRCTAIPIDTDLICFDRAEAKSGTWHTLDGDKSTGHWSYAEVVKTPAFNQITAAQAAEILKGGGR